MQNHPLVQYALNNIWCTPRQDLPSTIKPARISDASGAYNRIRVAWRTMLLPEKSKYFHVYSIGAKPAQLINIPQRDEWMKVSDVCNENGVTINIYTVNGITFPLTQSYLRVMDNGYVILALARTKSVPVNHANEDIYIRFYSNSYFYSERWRLAKPETINPIIAGGGVVGKDITLNEITTQINNIPHPTIGHMRRYHNGVLVSSFISPQPGDALEYFLDRSIKKVRMVKFSDLETFTSTTDSKAKHVIPPDEYGTTIDYHDDIDIYVTRDAAGNGIHRGVFHHRNASDAVRMLAHNSYSIADQYITSFVNANSSLLLNTNSVYLMLFIRHSGWERPLVHEHSRIKDLYKLDPALIKNAIVGVNALVPEWEADSLEKSEYTEIMSSEFTDITPTMVADALGYNAVTKLMSKAVHPPINYSLGDTRYVDRPMGMNDVSVFTYANGELRAWTTHTLGPIIHLPPPASQVSTVELLDGKLSESGSTRYGETIVESEDAFEKIGYRCYVCEMVDGAPNHVWEDVTDDDDYYVIAGGGKTIIWNETTLGNYNQYPATKIGNRVTLFTPPVNPGSPDIIHFTIAPTNRWHWPNTSASGADAKLPDTLPSGTLDVFMDNELLIEGIDYFVKWPEVCVVKKPKRVHPGSPVVRVRLTGFVNSDMSRNMPRDVGFVKDGMLSQNGRFDVRNDRNVRISVGGKFRRLDQVRFSEDADQGVDSPNGHPYAITDIIAPVESYLSDRSTVEFREEALDLDERVQDYLTQFIPDADMTIPYPIVPDLWELYSPFMAQIIFLLKDGSWLYQGELDGQYMSHEIETWIEDKGLDKLLEFDPLTKSLDSRFIGIHPHSFNQTVTLTESQYLFVTRVNDLYFSGAINFTPFITVV